MALAAERRWLGTGLVPSGMNWWLEEMRRRVGPGIEEECVDDELSESVDTLCPSAELPVVVAAFVAAATATAAAAMLIGPAIGELEEE